MGEGARAVSVPSLKLKEDMVGDVGKRSQGFTPATTRNFVECCLKGTKTAYITNRDLQSKQSSTLLLRTVIIILKVG